MMCTKLKLPCAVQSILQTIARVNGSALVMDDVHLQLPDSNAATPHRSIAELFSAPLHHATIAMSALFMLNAVLYYGLNVVSCAF